MPRKQITTTLDEDLLKALRIKAVEKDTTINRILEKLISEYLQKEEKPTE